eukprot:2863425-Rhodomonas_salina.1
MPVPLIPKLTASIKISSRCHSTAIPVLCAMCGADIGHPLAARRGFLVSQDGRTVQKVEEVTCSGKQLVISAISYARGMRRQVLRKCTVRPGVWGRAVVRRGRHFVPGEKALLSGYACGMRCPVLTKRMVLSVDGAFLCSVGHYPPGHLPTRPYTVAHHCIIREHHIGTVVCARHLMVLTEQLALADTYAPEA